MKKLLLISLGALMMASCAKDKKDYDATGTFEATEVTVSAESTGQLENFNVSEGEVLNGGLTVGQIDARQLTLKREQLTSSNEQLAATHGQLAANKRQLAANQLATSSKQLDLKKQVAAIRQQIANQQRERQRFAELLQDGAVARKQVDDIDYQIQVLLKQLAATGIAETTCCHRRTDKQSEHFFGRTEQRDYGTDGGYRRTTGWYQCSTGWSTYTTSPTRRPNSTHLRTESDYRNGLGEVC